jgi:hypothetical protein
LYDSRRGFGVFYRWQPRDIEAICSTCGVRPRLHRSLFERIARSTDDYAPGSVPPSFTVESTSLNRPALIGLENLVADHHGPIARPLMRQHDGWVKLGRWSYWLFVYAVMAMVLLALKDLAHGAPSTGLLDAGRHILGNFSDSGWLDLVFGTLRRHPIGTSVLVVSLLMGIAVDRHLDRVYSAFWHALRDRLTAALDDRTSEATPRAVFNAEHPSPSPRILPTWGAAAEVEEARGV